MAAFEATYKQSLLYYISSPVTQLSENFSFALYVFNNESNFWNSPILLFKKENSIEKNNSDWTWRLSNVTFWAKSNIRNNVYWKLLNLERQSRNVAININFHYRQNLEQINGQKKTNNFKNTFFGTFWAFLGNLFFKISNPITYNFISVSNFILKFWKN